VTAWTGFPANFCGPQPATPEAAREILDRRYAAGEIGKPQYEEMKRALLAAPPAPAPAATVKKIAIYGKGGIGKSTTSSNLAAAMAVQGRKVMLVGCDPKQDSTMNLNQGKQLPSVLERIYERGAKRLRIEDVCVEGPRGIILVESGGPEPGVGCAGRGVMTALQALDDLQVMKHFGIDVVIYDVLGDVVCGGFAMPLRQGYASDVYLVTSGEFMALYAANNICKAIERLSSGGMSIGLAGVILNSRNVNNEAKIVTSFAEQVQSRVVAQIPRDHLIQECEARNSTVPFEAPDTPLGRRYMELAGFMLSNRDLPIPRSIARNQLLELLGHGDADAEPAEPGGGSLRLVPTALDGTAALAAN
jgi:nitrogenase iron protein NifH